MCVYIHRVAGKWNIHMVIIPTHSWKHLLLLAKFKHAPPTTNSLEMASQITKYTISSAETPTLTPMQTHFIRVNCGCLVARSCPALCHPRNCGPPGSSVPGVSQAGILEWGAISSSRAGFPGGAGGKEATCQCRRLRFIPGSGRPPRRKWQPSPVFLSGKCHGRRSLVGYSPWGRKELDTTEHTPRRHLPDPGTNPGLWHQQADRTLSHWATWEARV